VTSTVAAEIHGSFFWCYVMMLCWKSRPMKTILMTYCKRFDSSCDHHQCIANWTAVIFLQVLMDSQEKSAVKMKNAQGCFGSDVVARSTGSHVTQPDTCRWWWRVTSLVSGETYGSSFNVSTVLHSSFADVLSNMTSTVFTMAAHLVADSCWAWSVLISVLKVLYHSFAPAVFQVNKCIPSKHPRLHINLVECSAVLATKDIPCLIPTLTVESSQFAETIHNIRDNVGTKLS